MFNELHPRTPRAPIPNEDQSGRNAANVAYPESQWVRCSRCGHVLNRARAGKGHGEGISQTTTNLATYDGTGSDGECYDSMFDTPSMSFDTTYDGPHYRTEPSAPSGCPFCGTYMFD